MLKRLLKILFKKEIHDIVEREIIEEKERHRSELALKEEYFRSLVENSSDIITILDSNGNFVYSTKSVESILGYKQGELIGRSAFDFIHPDDRQRIINVFQSIVRKPGIHPREEFRFLHKDGSWRYIESIGYNLLDNPAVRGVIVNTRDITGRKILEEEAIRSAQLASIGELAAGVAHEINNPINGIINYAQVLTDKYKDERGNIISEIPPLIIEEGNRIAKIVKSLLSFAHSGKCELLEDEKKTPVLIQDILSDTLSLIGAQMKKDSINLTTAIPNDLPIIFAVPNQIQQVFLNLLSNARFALNEKYSGKDDGKILEIGGDTVSINGSQYVRITFHDYGAGIPSKLLNKISLPFFTTKPRGKGTGLGLSICHNIIAKHGGRLVIDSVEGKFTKVAVVLPVSEAQAGLKT